MTAGGATADMLATIMTAIRTAERIFLAVIMIAMSVMFFVNVLARELSPGLAVELAWIEEATLFALAWMVFVGLGLTLEQRRHIAMSAYLDSLSPRIAPVLHKLINLSGLLFCLLLTKFSLDFAQFIYRSGQISPTLGFSMIGLYLPLPLGFALLSLRYLLELIGVQNRFAIKDTVADH
jgi:C4-dicarboxylate transporter DctQ subunit